MRFSLINVYINDERIVKFIFIYISQFDAVSSPPRGTQMVSNTIEQSRYNLELSGTLRQ
jgi:hypothetical protein